MNILIVENDPFIVEDIKGKLKILGYPTNSNVDNVNDALLEIEANKPSIVIVDIELNGEKNGIDLGIVLSQKKIPFVYLSEMQDLHTFDRALETNPQANIPKPVTILQLRNSLLEATKNKNSETNSETGSAFIMLSHRGKKHKINKTDIVFLKAARNNCEIYTADKKFLSSSPMNNVLSKLELTEIIRVHKSSAVNINAVSAVEGNRIFIKGYDAPIDMSEKYRRDFMNRFDTV